MSHVHPNDRAPAGPSAAHLTIEHVEPGRLLLHADPDAPGWTAEPIGDASAARPITVQRAVLLAGPAGARLVLDGTRAILDRLPVSAAAQLGAELASAERRTLAEADDALAAIRDQLDAVALIVPGAPDLMGELTRAAARAAEHVEAQRRQLDTLHAPMLAAFLGSVQR